jgi:hypothetical protein
MEIEWRTPLGVMPMRSAMSCTGEPMMYMPKTTPLVWAVSCPPLVTHGSMGIAVRLGGVFTYPSDFCVTFYPTYEPFPRAKK